MQSSNTPPDGDFARYVEELTRASHAGKAGSAGNDAPMAMGQQRPANISPSPTLIAHEANPAGAMTGERIKLPSMRLATHLRWVFGIFVGTQLLSVFVPGADFLFIPALLAYAMWVIFRLRRTSSEGLMKTWSGLSQRVAEEIRKAQQIQQDRQKNKP